MWLTRTPTSVGRHTPTWFLSLGSLRRSPQRRGRAASDANSHGRISSGGPISQGGQAHVNPLKLKMETWTWSLWEEWTWKITMISSNFLSLCEHLEVYYCSVFDCICTCIIWMSRPLTFLTRMFWMTFKRVWENEVWNTRKCSLGCWEADGSILSKLYLTNIFLLRWYQHKFALKLEMFFFPRQKVIARQDISGRPMGQNPARGSRLPRALWLASSGRARAVVIFRAMMKSWNHGSLCLQIFFAASSQAARYFDSKLFDIEIVVFFLNVTTTDTSAWYVFLSFFVSLGQHSKPSHPWMAQRRGEAHHIANPGGMR